MCTSESKINKKFTITTQDRIASHRISHLSSTRVPSRLSMKNILVQISIVITHQTMNHAAIFECLTNQKVSFHLYKINIFIVYLKNEEEKIEFL